MESSVYPGLRSARTQILMRQPQHFGLPVFILAARLESAILGQRGNPILRPEMTKSTEISLEMSFLNNRLRFDYAYYTNDSYDQILSPRGPQSTGYIFFSMNAGNVYNKGMELTVSRNPIETRDFRWDVSQIWPGTAVRSAIFRKDLTWCMLLMFSMLECRHHSILKRFMAIAGKWYRDDNGNHHSGQEWNAYTATRRCLRSETASLNFNWSE